MANANNNTARMRAAHRIYGEYNRRWGLTNEDIRNELAADQLLREHSAEPGAPARTTWAEVHAERRRPETVSFSAIDHMTPADVYTGDPDVDVAEVLATHGTPAERRVWACYEVHGRQADVARALGVTPGCVSQTMARIRAKLQKHIRTCQGARFAFNEDAGRHGYMPLNQQREPVPSELRDAREVIEQGSRFTTMILPQDMGPELRVRLVGPDQMPEDKSVVVLSAREAVILASNGEIHRKQFGSISLEKNLIAA